MLGKSFVTRVAPGRGRQYMVPRLQGAHVDFFVKSWAYIILSSNVDCLLTLSSLQSYASLIFFFWGGVSIFHKKLNPIGIRSEFEPGTSWIQVCYSCFSTDLLDNKPYYRTRNRYTSKSVSRAVCFVCLHLTRTAHEFLSSAATGCSVHFVVQGLSFISIGKGTGTYTFGAWFATLQVRGRSAVVRKPQVLSFGTRTLVQSGG
jgi:hypothetical protein